MSAPDKPQGNLAAIPVAENGEHGFRPWLASPGRGKGPKGRQGSKEGVVKSLSSLVSLPSLICQRILIGIVRPDIGEQLQGDRGLYTDCIVVKRNIVQILQNERVSIGKAFRQDSGEKEPEILHGVGETSSGGIAEIQIQLNDFEFFG